MTMKNKFINLLTVLAIVTTITSCTDKTENSHSDYLNSFTTGAYLRQFQEFDPAAGYLDKGTISNIIDAGNLANSRLGIKVRPWGAPISKVNVYGVKGSNPNPTAWKLIKTYNRTGTDTAFFDLIVTAQELATGLGIPLTTDEFAPGGRFTLYMEVITADGKKYTVNNTNADVTAPGNRYGAVFSFGGNVICPFVAAGFNGNAKVVVDAWEDWAVGDELPNAIVNSTQGATTSSIGLRVFPNPAFGGNNQTTVTVNINTATGVATVTDQYYGNYGTTGVSVSTVGTANFVYSCVGSVILLLRHHVPGNPALGYGNFALELKKL
jgi:hypothetical protein